MSRRELIRSGLWAGVAAPLLYLLIVAIGGVSVAGYHPLSEPISALTATGRTGVHWIEAGFGLYNLLVLVFAVAVLLREGRRWLGMSMGLVGIGLVGLLMWPFAMDLPGAGLTTAGRIHIVLAGLASGLSVAVALLAALAWFRQGRGGMAWFSVACVALLLVSGPIAAMGAAGAWPLAGLLERITIGVFELWLLINGLAFCVPERMAVLPGAPAR